MTIYIYDSNPGYLLLESLLACKATRLYDDTVDLQEGDLLLYPRYLHNTTRFHLLNGSRDYASISRNINELGQAEPIGPDARLGKVLDHPNGYLLLCNTWENFPIFNPLFQTHLAGLLQFVGLPAGKAIISCCDASAGPWPRGPTIKAFGLDWFYLREKVNGDTVRGVENQTPKQKYFVFLNRRFAADRFLTLLFLSQQELLGKVHLSFLSRPAPGELDGVARLAGATGLFGRDGQVLRDRITACAAGLPVEIDGNKDTVDWAGGDLIHERIRDAFFFIVHETLTRSTDALFISEKTYKPLRLGLPFLIYGSPFILEHLRDLGFRTFHPLIDERYDQEPDDVMRLRLFLTELDRIGRLTPGQVQQLHQDLIPVVRHNLAHLQNRRKADLLRDRLRQAGLFKNPDNRTNHDHAALFY